MTHFDFDEELSALLENGLLHAEKAELEDILFEFEHSDEFRLCSQGYLQSPEHILNNYLEECAGRLREFDPVELRYGVLTVLPIKLVDLTPRDTEQIIRELQAFWRFLENAHDFPRATNCLEILGGELKRELSLVLNLNNSGPVARVGPGIPQGDFLGMASDEFPLTSPLEQEPLIQPEEPFEIAA